MKARNGEVDAAAGLDFDDVGQNNMVHRVARLSCIEPATENCTGAQMLVVVVVRVAGQGGKTEGGTSLRGGKHFEAGS